MSSTEYTPQKFQQKLKEILDSNADIEEKIRAGTKLVDSSRLYFEDSNTDARTVLTSMMDNELGKTHPRNIILRQVWERQDRKVQSGIDFQWKR